MKDKYIEKAVELLDKPWWKDKPYSNAVNCVAGLLEQIEKYNELIMAVSNKYKGETRHETALKYIKRAEEVNGLSASQEEVR